METLCKIRDIQRAVASFEHKFEKCYNICLNEGMVLCSLQKTDSLTSGELGEMLGLTPSNVSKVLRSAENKGLIQRVIGAKDRRQMYFSLSNKGKNLIAEIKCCDFDMNELLKSIIKE